MAVPKKKVSRSRGRKRRTHWKFNPPTLDRDPVTGETHLRHHITPDGYYRGRQIWPSEEEQEELEVGQES